MKKIWWMFWAIVSVPFQVNTWRFIFTGRAKIRVFLSSGEHMDISVRSWNTDKTNGTITGWEFEDAYRHFQVNPTDIIAWIHL